VIEDKVVDMLLFVTLRYLKNFGTWKQKKLREIKDFSNTVEQMDTHSASKSKTSKSVGQDGLDVMQSVNKSIKVNRTELIEKQTQRLQNHVIGRMSNLLKLMVYEMHSY
jgi:hypothetical protein